MTAETVQQFEALEAQAQRLLGVFTRAGYEYVAPAIIQPAGLFLDVIGEALRARTYVFTDPEGEELCLRPDLTVPTCRLHLARHADGAAPARYCYNGPAFRYQPGGDSGAHPREFRQAGIESFADADREADDTAVLALIIEALREAGLTQFGIRIGDLSLFTALLDALPMPERWRWRLKHQFWRPEAFRAALQRLTSGRTGDVQGLPRALIDCIDPDDPSSAESLVEAHLADAGLELIGTRTLAEIAGRLRAEVADLRETPLPQATARLIERYLAIRSPAKAAAGEIARLTREQSLDLSAGLDGFERRLKLLQGSGIDTAAVQFSAEFGRNLEYYTAFVFEIATPRQGAASPVAGGGRYDGLLAAAGAPRAVPAVGSSIHTERLLAALDGGAA